MTIAEQLAQCNLDFIEMARQRDELRDELTAIERGDKIAYELLVNENRALCAEIAELKGAVLISHNEWYELCNERDRLAQEVTKLKESIAKACADLRAIGNDYPNSNLQEWCRSRAAFYCGPLTV